MGQLQRYSEWKEFIPDYRQKKLEKKHIYSSVVKDVISELGVMDVIDFGCGDGALCTLFAKNRYLGLDKDDDVLKKAQQVFEGYAFKKPEKQVFSADLCIASDVFNEINDQNIDAILARLRCKWLLIAEPLKHETKDLIHPFHSRDKDGYVKLMRAHDLLLMKKIRKTIAGQGNKEVTFLLFKKATKNPVA